MDHSQLQNRNLLDLARDGDGEALGQLLQSYRQYVELMARIQLGGAIRQKVAPSDVAQETFVQAHRSFHQFQGSTEAELLAWLRKIVASQLAMSVRRFQTQRRDVRLEQNLEDSLDQSSLHLADWLTAAGSSPSQGAARREQAVILANALGQLRADYRDVIILRHFQDCEFAEIARQSGKTVDSVKSTWARAIAKLRAIIVAS